MSATTTPTPLNAPNTVGAPTTREDQVFGAARDFPDFISKASALAPSLVAPFVGKSLLASKSPWGTLAGGIVAWAASRYGLGWDSATCDLVAGAGVLGGSYIMRVLTDRPITGVLRAATPSEAIANMTTQGTNQ